MYIFTKNSIILLTVHKKAEKKGKNMCAFMCVCIKKKI